MSGLQVDGERLLRDLAELAEIGRDPAGGITRTAFSPEDAEAREWYRAQCERAGLEVQLDGLGNMVAGLPSDADAPPSGPGRTSIPCRRAAPSTAPWEPSPPWSAFAASPSPAADCAGRCARWCSPTRKATTGTCWAPPPCAAVSPTPSSPP